MYEDDRPGLDRVASRPHTLRENLPREDPSGIELLQASQHSLDPIATATELLCHPVKAHAKVAILIEQIEKMQCDDPVAVVAKVDFYLLE